MAMADPREPLGRIVHDTRCAFAAEARPHYIPAAWEQRDPEQRELDMRIGSAVAARAVADAKLENERMKAQLLVLAACFPAFRRALTVAITEAKYDYEKRDYRAALAVISGGDKQERTDEKEAGQ